MPSAFHNLRIKKYCQTNEESIILNLLDVYPVTKNFLVDIGAGDGFQLSNTQLLIENGWDGCRFDARYDNGKDLHKERVTQENVCDLLEKYNVPSVFGLLSIDIDGIDLYVLNALLQNYRPEIVVFEFNGCRPPESFDVIAYDDAFFHRTEHGDYYGASWGAFRHVLHQHRYTLVDHVASLNGFAVEDGFMPKDVSEPPTRSQYHRHNPDAVWKDARDVFPKRIS